MASKDQVIQGITELISDKSVPASDALEALEQIHDFILPWLDLLREQVSNENEGLDLGNPDVGLD